MNKDGLIPWKPGESGNPAGRPKGSKDGLRAHLRRYLLKHPEAQLKDILARFDIKDGTIAEGLTRVLLHKAASGEDAALKMVFDQTEEPLKTTVEQTNTTRLEVTLPDEWEDDDGSGSLH